MEWRNHLPELTLSGKLTIAQFTSLPVLVEGRTLLLRKGVVPSVATVKMYVESHYLVGRRWARPLRAILRACCNGGQVPQRELAIARRPRSSSTASMACLPGATVF